MVVCHAFKLAVQAASRSLVVDRYVTYPCLMQRITVDLPKDWLSVADICEYMGVSTFVVTRMLRSGELPAVKFGREWRVAKTDFEDYLNRQRDTANVET